MTLPSSAPPQLAGLRNPAVQSELSRSWRMTPPRSAPVPATVATSPPRRDEASRCELADLAEQLDAEADKIDTEQAQQMMPPLGPQPS